MPRQRLRCVPGFCAGNALGDQGLVTIEKDKAHIVPPPQQDVAVAALQRGACDHDMITGVADAADLICDCLQPRPAVCIVKRLACAHLGDVAGGMKAIGILKDPAQAFGETR